MKIPVTRLTVTDTSPSCWNKKHPSIDSIQPSGHNPAGEEVVVPVVVVVVVVVVGPVVVVSVVVVVVVVIPASGGRGEHSSVRS